MNFEYTQNAASSVSLSHTAAPAGSISRPPSFTPNKRRKATPQRCVFGDDDEQRLGGMITYDPSRTPMGNVNANQTVISKSAPSTRGTYVLVDTSMPMAGLAKANETTGAKLLTIR